MLHTALEKIYTSRHEGQPSSSNLNISVISTTANKSDAAAQRLAVLGEKVNFKNDAAGCWDYTCSYSGQKNVHFFRIKFNCSKDVCGSRAIPEMHFRLKERGKSAGVNVT